MNGAGRIEARDLRRRLRRLGRGLYCLANLRRAALSIAGLGAAVLMICLGDNGWGLPAPLRLGLLLVLAGTGLVLLYRWWTAPECRSWSGERTARAVERRYGIAHDQVINAYQLGGEPGPFGPLLVERTLELMGPVRLWGLADGRRLLRVLAVLLVVLAAWALYWAGAGERARNALVRLLLPLADLPRRGSVAIDLEPDFPLTGYAGQDLTVTVTVDPGGSGAVPRLRVWRGAGGEKTGGDAWIECRGAGEEGRYRHRFVGLRRSLRFRARIGDTRSRLAEVTVRPLPDLRRCRLVQRPPAYAGLTERVHTTWPSELECLPGTELRLELECTAPPPARLVWAVGTQAIALCRKEGGFVGATRIRGAGPCELRLVVPRLGAEGERSLPLAVGRIRPHLDAPPAVAFTCADRERNRYVLPGSEVVLPIAAEDDLGLASLGIEAHRFGRDTECEVLRDWRFLGPPGRRGRVVEAPRIELDPRRFPPGGSFVFRATAKDFAPPTGQTARSGPVVLRVRRLDELRPAADDGTAGRIFDLIRRAAVEQAGAGERRDNLAGNLAEILAEDALHAQSRALGRAQERVQRPVDAARKACGMEGRWRGVRETLRSLRDGECRRLAAAVDELGGCGAAAPAESVLARIETDQRRLHRALLRLLGELAAPPGEATASEARKGKPGFAAARREADVLADELEAFADRQRRRLELAGTLADAGPMDLTAGEEEILGEFAREAEDAARHFQERITDFARLPDQDFADSELVAELNEVWQEMQAAADAWNGKSATLAVPHEQAGLESAEELRHNLERWLAETPDKTKWMMEEPEDPPDAPPPLADLPDELEDIVGELLDSEESMGEEVEDVSSAWADSLDKGAGWGTSDGPISNMSARGVTGNILPNRNEVGGRSGEGRSGRSHGQMVEESATGKGGRETPTRLTPSPFEEGSVRDESGRSGGGATGGGKLSGHAGEGLRGPTPPPELARAMRRLGGRQTELVQNAERLALELRRRNYPSADLETAVAAMRELATGVERADGGRLRQLHHAALDALERARRRVGDETRVRRERSRLGERRRLLVESRRDWQVPAGYEAMTERYFRRLAGEE